MRLLFLTVFNSLQVHSLALLFVLLLASNYIAHFCQAAHFSVDQFPLVCISGVSNQLQSITWLIIRVVDRIIALRIAMEYKMHSARQKNWESK